MDSLWNDAEARKCGNDPLRLRAYTSRLLGREPTLVLHGGGNTSVKTEETDLFGHREAILWIKGSGIDLATIEPAGFAPIRLDVLQRLAALDTLDDTEMVRVQRAAMIDPSAPDPSLEAILHGMIPCRFVDHTHADAVVAITNTADGEARIREIYGDRVLVVPYVMPGFALARAVRAHILDVDWKTLEGIILLGHGVVSFGDDAQSSYARMIRLVSAAEDYLDGHGAPGLCRADSASAPAPDVAEHLPALAVLRAAVSRARGVPMIARLDTGGDAVAFSNQKNVEAPATRGPLTPDHVTRTKRVPLFVGEDPEADVARYASAYDAYFERHTDGTQTRLDPAPRWAVWPGRGLVAFGESARQAVINADIASHTVAAIRAAEALGGWVALDEKHIFDVEYWALQQAKLHRQAARAGFSGKIVLVTGAASGIGRACVDAFRESGAAVAALDINDDILRREADDVLPCVCDVADDDALADAVCAAVRRFGGLDVVISNAGVFPPSAPISETGAAQWDRSLAVNLSSHQRLLKAAIPFLKRGVDPAVVIVASKNVPAPGPGASAYSVAKAGLTQLGRVAALELAPFGIRVNMIHPNHVFDTAIWTDDVLAERAKHYGMSIEQYKTNNLLGVEITSNDVATLACALAGPAFARTTGAQVPIDGGNDRVI